MNKKGIVLVENVIFVVLTLVVFAILIVFVSVQGNSAAIQEEKLCKQIVLLIDAAQSGTLIELDISKKLNIARKNNINKRDFVGIDNDNNLVIVKLRQDGFYDYAFFNDLDISYSINDNGILQIEVLE